MYEVRQGKDKKKCLIFNDGLPPPTVATILHAAQKEFPGVYLDNINIWFDSEFHMIERTPEPATNC